MGSFLTCDGFFREPVSGRLRLCARPAEVVIGRVVLLDGVTWPWVVTGPPGDKAGGLGREKEHVNHFLRLGRSLKVYFSNEYETKIKVTTKTLPSKFGVYIFFFNSQLDYCYCVGRLA